MEFKCNNEKWTIIEQEKKTLVDKYNSESEDRAGFVFGLTIYSKHEIWINKEMCEEQIIKTLKHELTHCYIWSFGLSSVPNFTEEMVCDLIACSSEFINDIVTEYCKSR